MFTRLVAMKRHTDLSPAAYPYCDRTHQCALEIEQRSDDVGYTAWSHLRC